MDDEIPTIDDEARAISLAYYRLQKEQITRLRQSLHEARDLIEELSFCGYSDTIDAARKWLEENPVDHP